MNAWKCPPRMRYCTIRQSEASQHDWLLCGCRRLWNQGARFGSALAGGAARGTGWSPRIRHAAGTATIIRLPVEDFRAIADLFQFQALDTQPWSAGGDNARGLPRS